MAVIVPSTPAGIGDFVHSGVVQPHEATILWITKGELPVFLTLKL